MRFTPFRGAEVLLRFAVMSEEETAALDPTNKYVIGAGEELVPARWGAMSVDRLGRKEAEQMREYCLGKKEK